MGKSAGKRPWFKGLLGRFLFLILRPQRTPRPLRWKAPYSRVAKQLPWTIRELHPAVTEIRGNTRTAYRSFELVFDSYRVEVILRGSEIDEIRLKGPSDTIGTRIDYIQKALPRQQGSENTVFPLILNYSDLDEFLRVNDRALEQYYRGGRTGL